VIYKGSSQMCKRDSPAGIYSVTDVPCLTILDDIMEKPVVKKTGVTYNQDMEAVRYSLRSTDLVAVHGYMLPCLHKLSDEKDLYLFPSTYSHNGRVWILNFDPKLIGSDDSNLITYHGLIARSIKSCFFKNVYPLTRVPFYTRDPLVNVFVKQLVLPKIVRKENELVTPLFEYVVEVVATNETLEAEEYLVSAYDVITKSYSAVDIHLDVIRKSGKMVDMFVQYLKLWSDLQLKYVEGALTPKELSELEKAKKSNIGPPPPSITLSQGQEVDDDKGDPVDSLMDGVYGDLVVEDGAEKRTTKNSHIF